MKKTIKILGLTLLSLLLLAAALLLATVKTLTPERLTPLVNEVANRALNADVSVGRVEVKLRGSLPFVRLEIDSLAIISRDIAALPADERAALPAWADTLATVGSIRGGINLAALAMGQVRLSHVEIIRPQANILLVNDSLNNFSIAKPSEPDADEATSIPDISIKSFRLLDPLPMRYYDAATATQLTARIRTVSLTEADSAMAVPSQYLLDIDTNISSPLFAAIGLSDVPITLDGTVRWKHERPLTLVLADFNYAVSLISGTVETELDFSDYLCAKSLSLRVDPMPLASMLAMLPDSTAAALRLPKDALTNATAALGLTLTRPYLLASGMLPYAIADLDIADCYLRWQKLDLRNLALSARAVIEGNNLDKATVDIRRLEVAGPATTISASGTLSTLISDPAFDGSISGHVNIDRLPPMLTAWLRGATASGTVSLNAYARARLSDFDRNNFHRLKVAGTIDARNLYYLSPDTLTMFTAHTLHSKFGTNESITRMLHSRRDSTMRRVTVDSLLSASVKVDSASLLVSGLVIDIADFGIGVGAQNVPQSDTTAIIPMGGGLKVGMFSLFTLSDTAGVRLRDLKGNISMRRFKTDKRLPIFLINAEIGRVSAGDNSTRFMVERPRLFASMAKLPDSMLSEGRREVKRLADSIHAVNPVIPPDSVYAMALDIRRRHRGKPRVQLHAAAGTDQEIIDWGTSSAAKRLLLDWRIAGSLKANRARLFTSAFPVRNRLEHLDIKFSNDSVTLDSLAYKAGHSDFTVSGSIANMKRAFTSRRHSPIKVDFDIQSDTIDVNELAQAFFTGAAHKHAKVGSIDLDDEALLDEALSRHEPDSAAGPLLIPVNVDARIDLHAANVKYDDFLLHRLQGAILAYDGAVNLHNLSAASDVGAIDLSALYAAPSPTDMKFGLGINLSRFNITNFLKLVPAVDSILPIMRDLGGIVSANIAATADVDSQMNIVLPSLDAAVNLQGDSLTVIDPATFRTIAKWLMFKDKNRNVINHMSVDIVVKDNMMRLYPFVFDFDRYKLGVQGTNSLSMNYDFHVAVLKSPIPFRFGVNISGHGDHFKVRLGKARFNEETVVKDVALADTTRVNLINQLENVFKRGVRNSRFATVNTRQLPAASKLDLSTDTLSRADSLYLKEQGLLPQDH